MTSSYTEESGPYYSTLPEDTEARLPPTTRLLGGRIEIVKELARGGMAIVYRAKDHERGGAEVAFKVVTSYANAEDTEGRYRNEARLGNSLAGDPQFVPPLAVGCLEGPPGFEGRMFLITELVAGRSLDKVMIGHGIGMPIERVVALATGIARALVSLHERGIVHRDIKPGNVLLENEGEPHERVRLIDFGLAYATGDGWEPQSPDLTREGHAPGTPIYMSPQQMVHERPTPAFDIYSFGAMSYELISGRPPNHGLGLQALLSHRCDPLRRPFSIGKMRPATPKHIAELVDRCLSYDPQERPTAAEFVQILEPREKDDRGATAPDLRVVPPPPTVVAQGARPAGDVTRAHLKAKAVPLPFVKREAAARTTEPEVDRAEADVEETTLVPKHAVAAMLAAPPQAPRASAGVLEATTMAEPTSEVRPHRRWILALIPILLLGVAAAAFAAYSPTEPVEKDTPGPREAASVPTADRKATDEKAPPRVDRPPTPSEQVQEPEPPPLPDERENDPAPKEDVKQTKAPPSKPRRERPSKDDDAEPAGAPSRPSSSKAECAGVVDKAQAAWSGRAWEKVSRLTTNPKCWSDRPQLRIRLRTSALLELGQYEQCVRVGKKSNDVAVARWVGVCRRKLQDGGGA